MRVVKSRRTQEQRSATTQQKLAQAAFELIRDEGYANFRVATVARLTGVSQGGQLHHFPTKDLLTMAVIKHAIRIARARTAANLDHYSDGDNVVAAISKDSCDYYFSASFDVAMDVVKSVSKKTDLRRDIGKVHLEFRVYAETGWLKILSRQGWREDNAHDLIAMTTSLVRGFAIRSTIQPNHKEVDRLMARWQEMVSHSFDGAFDGAFGGPFDGSRP